MIGDSGLLRCYFQHFEGRIVIQQKSWLLRWVGRFEGLELVGLGLNRVTVSFKNLLFDETIYSIKDRLSVVS